MRITVGWGRIVSAPSHVENFIKTLEVSEVLKNNTVLQISHTVYTRRLKFHRLLPLGFI